VVFRWFGADSKQTRSDLNSTQNLSIFNGTTELKILNRTGVFLGAIQ